MTMIQLMKLKDKHLKNWNKKEGFQCFISLSVKLIYQEPPVAPPPPPPTHHGLFSYLFKCIWFFLNFGKWMHGFRSALFRLSLNISYKCSYCKFLLLSKRVYTNLSYQYNVNAVKHELCFRHHKYMYRGCEAMSVTN